MEHTTNVRKQKTPNLRLKQAREQRLWTLEEVAKHISELPDFAPGIPDPRTVARWERGTSFPSPRYCRALCTIFEMDAHSLELTPLLNNHKNDFSHKQQASVDDENTLATEPLIMPTPPMLTTMVDSLSHSLPQQSKSKTYRQYFIEKVRSFWINKVLEQSFQHMPYMRLLLQFQPDAIHNPWQSIVPRSPSSLCTFSDNAAIAQIYDEADGALLILGATGAGKTTLLLTLAQLLLARAEQDELHAIPVILNLSFWTNEHHSLTQWCIEELYDKYQVKQDLCQQWMQNEQILLLLDGLDEISPPYRNTCIEAINTYRHEHSLVPLVICCRHDDYMMQPTLLLVQTAIVIQPFTPQQIDSALEDAEGPLLAACTMLQNNPTLQNLVTTPLWMKMLILTLQRISTACLADNTTQVRQVIATYVQHMFERQELIADYTIQQMQQWLRWLAQQMHYHQNSTFYPKHIQPTLLENKREQHLYTLLALRLPFILLGILIGSGVSVLCCGYFNILALILYGSCSGIIANALYTNRRSLFARPSHRFPAILRNSFYIFAFFILLATMMKIGKTSQEGDIKLQIIPIILFFIFGLNKFLLHFFLKIQKYTPEPEQSGAPPVHHPHHKRTKRRYPRQSLLIGGLFGVYVGLSNGLHFLASSNLKLVLKSAFRTGIPVALGVMLCYWLLASFFRGLENVPPTPQNHLIPTQKISCSSRSLLLACLIGSFVGSLGYVLYNVFLTYFLHSPNILHLAILNLLLTGLITGFSIAMLYKGLALLQHAVLRLLLWRIGGLPWQYVHFLDAATKRQLLHKTKDGYTFSHPYLQDYFANSTPPPIAIDQ